MVYDNSGGVEASEVGRETEMRATQPTNQTDTMRQTIPFSIPGVQVDVRAGEPKALFTEASDVGLRPSQWPSTVRIDGEPRARGFDSVEKALSHQRPARALGLFVWDSWIVRGDEQWGALYRAPDGYTLAILND